MRVNKATPRRMIESLIQDKPFLSYISMKADKVRIHSAVAMRRYI
jgi:hypothetical protein